VAIVCGAASGKLFADRIGAYGLTTCKLHMRALRQPNPRFASALP
jgi:hypothetical protein